MPTLDASWSGRLRVIGDLERPDHWFLTGQDDCAFFGEYTARAGYGHSSTNQLIHNLKKKLETRHTPQWKWKGHAIREIGQAIATNLNPGSFGQTAFVPIPPSKPAEHPEYGDRMAQVARAISPNADVREVLFTVAEREPAHAIQNQRDPHALRATLGYRTELLAHAPPQVVILDDVLTTGCSFQVCKAMLREAWPEAEIFGLFVARRVIDRSLAAADFMGIDIDL